MISEWRHDLAKGKFSSISEKYDAWRNANVTVGFDFNLQTMKLGHGIVTKAQARLEQMEFGLTDYFHVSVCVLLFALHLDEAFSKCDCNTSPLDR